jgi:multicomponent Na+:H+ antiporter subunit B
MEFLFNLILLLFLAAVTIGIIGVRNLFAVVVLSGAYSFLMATLLIAMDAVDVGMTEAAVGAGVSTVLLLSALHLTNTEEAPAKHSNVLPMALALLTGAVLVYGTWDLPRYGDPDTPMNSYVGDEYLERSIPETTIPNVVTSVLASYRGYDTLGETAVIFTAGIGVLMLLYGRRRKGDDDEGGDRS